jgi:hypothetical protein
VRSYAYYASGSGSGFVEEIIYYLRKGIALVVEAVQFELSGARLLELLDGPLEPFKPSLMASGSSIYSYAEQAPRGI